MLHTPDPAGAPAMVKPVRAPVGHDHRDVIGSATGRKRRDAPHPRSRQGADHGEAGQGPGGARLPLLEQGDDGGK